MADFETKYGLNMRVYVAPLTATTNADYKVVENENKLVHRHTTKPVEVEMKSNNGQIATLDGPEMHEIQIDAVQVYADDGAALLRSNVGKRLKVQLRDEEEDIIELKGTFYVESGETSSEAGGARAVSYALKGAGDVQFPLTEAVAP